MLNSRYLVHLYCSLAEGIQSGLHSTKTVAIDHLRRINANVRHTGQGLVEYAIILVLIAIVVIGTLSLLGTQVSSVFQQITCQLGGATGNSNSCATSNANGGGNNVCNNGNGNGNGNGNCNNNGNGNGNGSQ
jgi:Flp pilus assembly pilin Flp